MCRFIEEVEIFHRKEINLNGTKLPAADVESVSLFLMSSSHKQYVGLNQLAPSSFIRDIALSCKVEELLVNGNNAIGKSKELYMYTMLTHPSSMLSTLVLVL